MIDGLSPKQKKILENRAMDGPTFENDPPAQALIEEILTQGTVLFLKLATEAIPAPYNWAFKKLTLYAMQPLLEKSLKDSRTAPVAKAALAIAASDDAQEAAFLQTANITLAQLAAESLDGHFDEASLNAVAF